MLVAAASARPLLLLASELELREIPFDCLAQLNIHLFRPVRAATALLSVLTRPSDDAALYELCAGALQVSASVLRKASGDTASGALSLRRCIELHGADCAVSKPGLKLLQRLEASSNQMSARQLIAELWRHCDEQPDEATSAAMLHLMNHMEATEYGMGTDKVWAVGPETVARAKNGMLRAATGMRESGWMHADSATTGTVRLMGLDMMSERADVVLLMGAADGSIPGANRQPR